MILQVPEYFAARCRRTTREVIFHGASRFAICLELSGNPRKGLADVLLVIPLRMAAF